MNRVLTHFGFVSVLSIALAAPLFAQDAPDAPSSDSSGERAALTGAVSALRPHQDAHRKADQAYQAAKHAYDQQAALVSQKTDSAKQLRDQEAQTEKQAQKAADKAGTGSDRSQIDQMQADFKVKIQGLEADILTEKNKLDDLKKPAADAKREADKQNLLYQSAKKQVDNAAGAYQIANCSGKKNVAKRVLGKIGHEAKEAFTASSDPAEIDCAEIKELLGSGLCKGEKIETLLPQVGIQAKTPKCDPAAGGDASTAADPQVKPAN